MKRLCLIMLCILTCMAFSISSFSAKPPVDTPVLETVLTGDLNGNGKIDTNDARHIYLVANGMENVDENKKNILDMNSDGKLNDKDVSIILKICGRLS